MKKRLILVTAVSFAVCITVLCAIISSVNEQYFENITLQLVIIPIVICVCAIIIINKIIDKFLLPFNQLVESINNYLKGDNYNFKFDSPYKELKDISQIFQEVAMILEKYKNRAHLENEKSSLILDNINEGLLVLDADQDVLMINSKAREILHCSEDISNINILHYIDNPTILKNIDSAQKKHKNRVFDAVDLLSNKTYRYYISIVSDAAFDKNGIGMLILIMDVSEIIQAEQVRKDFTSNVNEQMKKPVEKIIDNLSKIKKSLKKGNEQYKIIKKSLSEAASLRGIINDAILITELETLDDDTKKIPVDLRATAESLIPFAQTLAEDKSIQIKITGNAAYTANPKRMEDLIKNLLSNAIKYNKDKGKVDIKLEDNDKEIKIKVSDTGSGINAEEKDRIFERFYRGKSRAKDFDEVPGSGLGLSIVKHIMQLYNGTIDINSEADKGTTIILTLPKKKKNKIEQVL